MSCKDCEKIYLINLQDEDQEPIVAYTSKYVGAICLGETGTLYTARSYSGVVSVLDCSTTTFILKHKFPTINHFGISDTCYMKNSGMIVLSSYAENRIYAVSSDGHIVWDISPRIDGKKVESRGLVIYRTRTCCSWVLTNRTNG